MKASQLVIFCSSQLCMHKRKFLKCSYSQLAMLASIQNSNMAKIYRKLNILQFSYNISSNCSQFCLVCFTSAGSSDSDFRFICCVLGQLPRSLVVRDFRVPVNSAHVSPLLIRSQAARRSQVILSVTTESCLQSG